jgi:hypothetical protein
MLAWIGIGRKSNSARVRSSAPPARHSGSATAHLFEKQRTQTKSATAGAAQQTGDGFNPYDTGKFDRSASWERISKTQR